MSDDRELLDLAAKAVGITLDFTVRGDYPPYFINERGGHSSWNPLLDDGDALRLAVKVGLDFSGIWQLYFGNEQAQAQIEDIGESSDFITEDHDGDSCAATRRVIVLAAARIGRSTPMSNRLEKQ